MPVLAADVARQREMALRQTQRKCVRLSVQIAALKQRCAREAQQREGTSDHWEALCDARLHAAELRTAERESKLIAERDRAIEALARALEDQQSAAVAANRKCKADEELQHAVASARTEGRAIAAAEVAVLTKALSSADSDAAYFQEAWLDAADALLQRQTAGVASEAPPRPTAASAGAEAGAIVAAATEAAVDADDEDYSTELSDVLVFAPIDDGRAPAAPRPLNPVARTLHDGGVEPDDFLELSEVVGFAPVGAAQTSAMERPTNPVARTLMTEVVGREEAEAESGGNEAATTKAASAVSAAALESPLRQMEQIADAIGRRLSVLEHERAMEAREAAEAGREAAEAEAETRAHAVRMEHTVATALLRGELQRAEAATVATSRTRRVSIRSPAAVAAHSPKLGKPTRHPLRESGNRLNVQQGGMLAATAAKSSPAAKAFTTRPHQLSPTTPAAAPAIPVGSGAIEELVDWPQLL